MPACLYTITLNSHPVQPSLKVQGRTLNTRDAVIYRSIFARWKGFLTTAPHFWHAVPIKYWRVKEVACCTFLISTSDVKRSDYANFGVSALPYRPKSNFPPHWIWMRLRTEELSGWGRRRARLKPKGPGLGFDRFYKNTIAVRQSSSEFLLISILSLAFKNLIKV